MEQLIAKFPPQGGAQLGNLFGRRQADRAAPSSESCNVEGIASGGRGHRAASYRPSPPDQPDSTTVLVNSSTNNGTPSVLLTICCTTSGGRALPPCHFLDHRLDLRSS